MGNYAEKVKTFLVDHEGELMVGTAIVGTFVLGYLHSKTSVKTHEITVNNASVLTPLQEAHQIIDEDIFTDLAIQIENMVFEDGLNKGTVEKKYTIPYDSGSIVRKVVVTVEDICGKEVPAND